MSDGIAIITVKVVGIGILFFLNYLRKRSTPVQQAVVRSVAIPIIVALLLLDVIHASGVPFVDAAMAAALASCAVFGGFRIQPLLRRR